MTRRKPPKVSIKRLAFQGGGEEKDENKQGLGTLQTAQTPIDQSLSRHRVTAIQHATAERYRAEHQSVFRSGIKSLNLEQSVKAPKVNGFHVENQGLDMASWRKASKFIAESLSADHLTLLTHVIIDEIPASHAAKMIGKPARTGIGMLRQCLDALERFYSGR